MKDKRGKNEEGGKSMDRGESDREEELSANKLKKEKMIHTNRNQRKEQERKGGEEDVDECGGE